ncbi:hypothetical protein MN116_006447 [Schistosoma mekongi]|uniref:TraB domain-containing protein n=1 Tax=Schistosoma mekongi TaxID=38744 RepID=A0AAE1ZBE1_SCHME|nr:hypothetical protein MN116_006447 [Schistosoma mekongi]
MNNEPVLDSCEGDTDSLSDDVSTKADALFMSHINWVRNQREQHFELPETVSVIECENHCKVYLIGTAHFSEESISDVKKVMELVHPDIVVLELCPNRSQTLTMDEENIKKQLKNISIASVVRSHGVSSGVLHYLLLRLNGYLVDTLGMAPGGEFRAAANEAMKQPHCHIVLGDRPVNITLYRALETMGPWTKLKFFLALLFSFQPVTKEQIEEMKRADFLEKLLVSMAGEHPELTHILLDERDQYLARSIWETTGMEAYMKAQIMTNIKSEMCNTSDNQESVVQRHKGTDQVNDSPSDRSTIDSERDNLLNSVPPLQLSCCMDWPPPSVLPRVVVAVCGIGHVSGIRKFWSTVQTINKRELCVLLEPPLSWRIFKWSLRAVLISLAAGVAYGLTRCSYIFVSFVYNRLL